MPAPAAARINDRLKCNSQDTRLLTRYKRNSFCTPASRNARYSFKIGTNASFLSKYPAFWNIRIRPMALARYKITVFIITYSIISNII